MQRPEERVSEQFNIKSYLAARQLSYEVVHELAHSLAPGIWESEAHQLAKEIFARRGVTKLWHPTKIRFGINTLCTFREESAPGIRLGEGDLYYIDIGPVVENHEGDYGETFRCGGGSDALIESSREIFLLTEKAWREQQLTGEALYNIAQNHAQKRGYQLDRRSAGHRCGDFPHALFHKGKLLDFSASPQAGLWILEIHLTDQARERGAFFEDVLGWEDIRP